ncbi:MAG: hypothetical protein ACJAVK_000851 [Akkermansiaceae bacterium]|jgi:hypothetical protein
MKLPPKSNTTQEQAHFNNPIYGQKGEYSLSASVRVPYFTALMDLKRVTKELKTHEEVTPSLENSYNLVELFQRTIDPERVKKEIVEGFLKNPNKLKFFNSLTFVLLPKDRSGKILREFEGIPGGDPAIPYDGQDQWDAFFDDTDHIKSVFGGVQFVETTSAAMSRLRWDSNSVDAVAVDGQHRLKSLKMWMSDNNYELAETARNTRVPIIFLLLHESVGFKSAPGGNSGIKSIAREIFTDLNKNAKEVDLATQIILDDRSLASCCVRSMITEGTCMDDPNKLPLSLLRWQDANSRFDQKYYLNSLVNLHLIVEDILDLSPPIKDPMNKSKALSFINDAKARVGMPHPETGDLELICDGMDLAEFYKQKFLDDETGDPTTPLTGLPPQFLPKAVEGFNERFSSWMLKILREFKPYQKLLDYASDNGLISGEFAQFVAQPKDHREQLKNEMESKHGENWEEKILYHHERVIENQIKSLRSGDLGEQWAFKTIFQKAIMRFAKELFVDIPEDQRDKYGDVDQYLSVLNRLYDCDLLRVGADLPNGSWKLWTFISVNYGGGKIKVASTSEKRIQALIALLYYSLRHISEKELKLVDVDIEVNDGEISAVGLEKIWRTKQASSEWANSYDHYQSLYKEFVKSADIIKGVEDGDIDDQARAKAGRDRIVEVLGCCLKCFTPQEDVDVKQI